MRLSTILVMAWATGGVAHADTLPLHPDLEVGLDIGGAHIHQQGGMLAGGNFAAGASWHAISLLATGERDGFIPTADGNPSVKLWRFGWRARYDLELDDDVLGRGPARSKMIWYFDAGTGEQLISWDGAAARRSDFSFGTGFSMLVYVRGQNTLQMPPWGINVGFEMTSAAALPAIDPSGEATRVTAAGGSASGRENAYLFTFRCRFL